MRCGDDEGDALSRACGALNGRLRECGVVTRGRLPCEERLWFTPERGQPDEVACQYSCYANTDCSVAQYGVCSESTAITDADRAALSECFSLCARQHGFQCATADDASGAVSASALCDGQNDCTNQSDEADCSSFPCGDGQVVTQGSRCDGVFDCSNKMDEVYCGAFACGEGLVLPLQATCDGVPDCLDGSDERGCGEGFYLDCTPLTP